MALAFSARIPADLAPNRVAVAVGRLRAAGVPIVDLTESNPTRVGFDYPDGILGPLADPAAARYEPEPFGLQSAREAVSAEFARRGHAVPPSRIVLTASTSEAYSLLFKVLCDPGDRVLVPHPSYPLFEHLARLDAVTAVPYQLDYHGLWRIDLDSVVRGLRPGTRAVVVVSPNNPTGSCLHVEDLGALAALAAEHGLALIGDEVFAGYPMEDGARWPGILEAGGALAFSLGGLSKAAGLPQVKLGWIGAAGPEPLVAGALARLEIACDTYLSVSTPVQHAAPRLLAAGALVRAQISARVRANYRWLLEFAATFPACRVLPAEAGWYAVVQVPGPRPEEDLVLSLLAETHVLVHPGYFFDFPREAFLVLSLLPPLPDFAGAVEQVFRHVAPQETS